MTSTENYQKSVKQYRKTHNEYHQRVRRIALLHYGEGKIACVRCGFSDIRALSIDHINGKAPGENIKAKSSNKHIGEELAKLDYPQGYQTLCMNCQFIKRHEENEHNQATKR